MNYDFDRPLIDEHAAARVPDVRAVAPQIRDSDSWHAVWLESASTAEYEQRWLDAATQRRQAEFDLPADDMRNGLYDVFGPNR